MRSEIAIDIAAPPALVFHLARDVTRWAALLPHYASVTVLGRDEAGAVEARFVARRPLVPLLGIGLPVTWRSRTWSDPDALQLRFLHHGGATSGMDVTWRIEPGSGGRGCRVTIEHDFRPRIPGWAAFIDRFFTRPIAGRTLATFRALAEAVQAAGDADPESVRTPGP
jgi:ribosome-associated toxin RatA of RatAB toxin-antitoxin module